MNDATRIDVSHTDGAPREFEPSVATTEDARRAQVQQHVQPEMAPGLGTLVAAVPLLLVSVVVTTVPVVIAILVLGLVAGLAVAIVGVIGMMPILGPVILVLAIPAAMVAGRWRASRRDSRPPVTIV